MAAPIKAALQAAEAVVTPVVFATKEDAQVAADESMSEVENVVVITDSPAAALPKPKDTLSSEESHATPETSDPAAAVEFSGFTDQELPLTQATIAPMELTEASTEHSVEQPKEPLVDKISVWEAELAKDDVEVLEDLGEALLTYSEANLLSVEATEGFDMTLAEREEIVEDYQPTPAIVLRVAERLKSIEPESKAQIAAVLKSITGAVHGLLLLEERQADPKQIEEVQIQLKELCVQLFENLEVEYDEADVEQLVSVILKLNLSQDSESNIPITNLSDKGTHEAKLLNLRVSGNTDTQDPLHQVLGMFVLFNAWRAIQPKPTPALAA